MTSQPINIVNLHLYNETMLCYNQIIVNKKLNAASYIYRFTLNAEISKVKCLTASDAEVFEFVAKPNAKITQRALKFQDFPEEAKVGGIIRGDKAFIAHGDTEIREGDKAAIIPAIGCVNQERGGQAALTYPCGADKDDIAAFAHVIEGVIHTHGFLLVEFRLSVKWECLNHPLFRDLGSVEPHSARIFFLDLILLVNDMFQQARMGVVAFLGEAKITIPVGEQSAEAFLDVESDPDLDAATVRQAVEALQAMA